MSDNFKTKIPQLAVDPDTDNPFAEDSLNRKELCEGLTNFIENATTPYTLAINAGWGNGKTVFLQMLHAHLRNQGYRCVFFDAWQADFYKDALPALIGGIKEQIKTNRTFNTKAKALSKALISPDTLQVIAALAAKSVSVGGEVATELTKAIKKSLQEHDAVEHYRSYRQALDKFKQALKKAAESNGKPLVILVDELDRCRPDFALDVLEKVKHVFDVKSVFFIFALNKEQLEKTIKKIYGEIDAKCYLRRFFDQTINLVNKTDLVDRTVETIGLDKLLEKSIMRNDRRREFLEYLRVLFKMFQLSLRDQEQVIATINLFFLMTPSHQHTAGGEFTYPIMLAYFSIVKLVNPELYQKSKIGADRHNPAAFPFEEHLEFYKKHAGFEKAEDTDKELYQEHRTPLFYLHCLYSFSNSKHGEYVKRKCEEYKQSEAAKTYGGNFWCDIHELKWTCYSTPMNDINAFINKIDSIGKLVASPEEVEES